MTDTSKLDFSSSKSNSRPTKKSLMVVGIGASAGGLDALEKLFDNLPADSGAAFVIIQHLSPGFKSLMKELLSRHTDMNVYQVTHRMELQPNSVYLIPPGKTLLVEANLLHLEERKKNDQHQPELTFPIDLFFTSLAKNFKEQSFGVILSGTGSDGSYGARAINEAGGIVLVQDPDTAEFDGMPINTITTGVVNRVLPIKELTQLIYECVTSPRDTFNLEGVQNSLVSASGLEEIKNLLLETEKIDFSYYKPSTMSRRIHRRRLIEQLPSLDSYIKFLRESIAQRSILCADLLINVTRFFRDPPAWVALEKTILPLLVAQAQPHEELRFWVAGCSTGEEAYSLAMLVVEALENTDKSLTAKIFATDLDRVALEKAAQGVYPKSIANHVSVERLQKYFLLEDDSYRVMRKLREMLIFSPHDLCRDVAFTRMHFVTCRNVLIYVRLALQQYILRNFHFSLNYQGILFLGEAESVGEFASEFDSLNSKWKIYQKRRDIRLPNYQKNIFPVSSSCLVHTSKPKVSKFDTKSTQEHCLQRILQDSNSTILLISRENKLLHVYGDSSQIIKPLYGEVAKDVTKMVISPLQLPLNTALHRVRKDKKAIAYNNLKGEHYNFRLKILPPEGENGDFYLAKIEQELLPGSSGVSPPEQFEIAHVAPQRILELESELQYTRENLQTLIKELETNNEEQQATNEELTASNEELQSTNEELHSVNEELYTVNGEFQSKIEELTQLNNDVDNLLRSTDIGVVFLDLDLNIRKFTPAATVSINLVSADINRPLKHITHNLDYPNLIDFLADVIKSPRTIHQEVKLAKSDFYLLMLINPYLLEDGSLDGLVLTFVDIDELKTIQQQINSVNQELQVSQLQLSQLNQKLEQRVVERTQALQESEARLRAILTTTTSIVYLKDLEGRYLLANKQYFDLFELTEAELLGKTARDIFPSDIADVLMANDRQVQSTKSVCQFEEQILPADGNPRTYISIKAPLINEQGEVYATCGISTDISQQKQTEVELREAVSREKTLLRVVEKIHQSLDLTEIFDTATENIRTTLKCDRVTLYRFNTDWSGDFVAESVGSDWLQLNQLRDSWHDTYLQETTGARYQHKGTLAVEDIDQAGFSDCHREIYTQIQAKAFAIVPIFQGEQLWGLLSVYQNDRPRSWKEAEIQLLTQVGIQLGISLAQVDLFTQVQAQKAAEIANQATNQAKDAFISRMSHELRTPLNTILGFSSVLQQDLINQPQKLHSVEMIQKSGEHLLALINSVLDFSKISAKKLELEPSEFNLILFLSEIASIFELKAQQKGLTFSTQILPSLPTTVNFDQVRLREVLFNLLSNAIKYTKTGGVTLKVGYPNPSSSKIRFQVEDTGIGIPESKIDYVFAPFTQLSDRSTKLKGTGLGLSICQELVQLMGGEIQLASQISQGSKFWFELEMPVVANPVPVVTDLAIATPKQLNTTRKILVVDDHDDSRNLLTKYLRSINFTVQAASNGQEALEVAATFEPHAIVTDLAMPVMDGLEMITQIKQQPRFQEVIVIAISANSKYILKSAELICAHFLSKPVDLFQLLTVLDKHLNLDWQTSEEKTKAKQSTSIIVPEQQELISLLEVVQIGDLELIESQIDALETKDSQYLPFVKKVRELALSFQQEQLEQFINGQLT